MIHSIRPAHARSRARRSGRLVARPPAACAAAAAIPPLNVPLVRGPYQNNGASPWYANISLGTPGQPLKIALDTGGDFIWVTSSLCGANGCQHYGGGQFAYQNSPSFQWIDQTPQPQDFGPWGSMTVETGLDQITLPSGAGLEGVFYLSANYSGAQFQQLDWDGGIGFPSGTDYIAPGTDTSFFYAELLNAGLADPSVPYVSFSGADPSTGLSSVLIGGYDPSAYDPTSGIFLPWTGYTQFPNVEYIWSTPLNQYSVGGRSVATGVQFCLDSGSSQFKGDNAIMNTTLALVGPTGGPDVALALGFAGDGQMGQIVVPPSTYMVEMEAGPQQGQTLPQFNPLGLTDLVLVGSVLMDQLYTIHHYDITELPVGGYHLAPVGMYVFNRVGGANLIQNRSQRPFAFCSRAPRRI